jgi:hypothetical protein
MVPGYVILYQGTHSRMNRSCLQERATQRRAAATIVALMVAAALHEAESATARRVANFEVRAHGCWAKRGVMQLHDSRLHVARHTDCRTQSTLSTGETSLLCLCVCVRERVKSPRDGWVVVLVATRQPTDGNAVGSHFFHTPSHPTSGVTKCP